MIDDLKPYSNYKESGHDWLGLVPQHWSVLPNRALFAEVNERDHPDEEMLSVTITQGVIRQKKLLASGSKKDSSNQDKSAYKLVCPRDIAYNKMRAWQGAIGVSNLRGIISPAYVVMRLREPQNERYFHYLYRTPHFAKEAERWSYGITSDMWSLRPEHFKIIYSPLPPHSEQTAIVCFLDYADQQAERYIRAKKKVIALLTEQKQAIIHRAVTRGINAKVPLKPSGIFGLGDVPEHWGILLLGRCMSRIEQGWSPVAAEGELAENQWAVLTLSCVKRGKFNSSAIKPISMTADVPRELEVHKDDFLLTRSNTRNLVGDVCIVDDARPKTILSDLIYRLRIKKDILDPQFLMYELLSPLGRWQIERDARGSSGTMPKLAQGHIKSWRILLPPLKEQEIIIEHIVNETKQIDLAIAKTQDEINLLREYRTRLITDVVTGKLDVREVAARLPAGEMSSLDSNGEEDSIETEFIDTSSGDDDE